MSGLNYSASGKLLLFGEYLVLRGAKSLAVPTTVGQSLSISKIPSGHLHWRSVQQDIIWFEAVLSPTLSIVSSTNTAVAMNVKRLLELLDSRVPDLLVSGLSLTFQIDFDRNYGLGTSSTLISLLSQWSGVDPYFLLEKSFGGSGYDVAAATASGPFIYQTTGPGADAVRTITEVSLPGHITENLLFVYTGRKQDSRSQVASFKSVVAGAQMIDSMNHIIKRALSSTSINDFESEMAASETLLGDLLQMEPIRRRFFPDYPYQIKSLGAWGGDFLMASCRDLEESKQYFQNKGMYPIFNYSELMKK